MAIVGQKSNYELYVLYEQLNSARYNFVNLAAQIENLKSQIEALQNFDADSSADEKTYIGELDTVAKSVVASVPMPPSRS
jgi:hypothetical protein